MEKDVHFIRKFNFGEAERVNGFAQAMAEDGVHSNSPGMSPVQLSDCLPQLLKFVLQYSINGFTNSALSPHFCSTLLNHDHDLHLDIDHSSKGVPLYPLYKRLASALEQWIISGSFAATSDNVATLWEDHSMEEMKDNWNKLVSQRGFELIDMLKSINFELHVQEPLFSQLKDGIKTVEGRCAVGNYNRIQTGDVIFFNKCLMLEVQGLGYRGIQSLLGLKQTVGTIPEALPPPRSTLFQSFALPHNSNRCIAQMILLAGPGVLIATFCLGAALKNPYVKSADPCGSSSGSAISVAANLVAVSLGTDTHSSIICPSDHNSAVGLRPTVGLVSRAGIIPISSRQDTVGPISRTVSDCVYVLDEIVGPDPRDKVPTTRSSKFIPQGGYKQFLNQDGLRGKRLGIVRVPFVSSLHESTVAKSFERLLDVLRERGVILVDNLEISHINDILNPHDSGELKAMVFDFNSAIAEYLKELESLPVRSLADIIAFNEKNPELEKTHEYGQDGFIGAEEMHGNEVEVNHIVEKLYALCKEGFEKMMEENELDAMVSPGTKAIPVMAIGGYPGITLPAGYDEHGVPFGMLFSWLLKGSEPKLIESAYGHRLPSLVYLAREKRPKCFHNFKAGAMNVIEPLVPSVCLHCYC